MISAPSPAPLPDSRRQWLYVASGVLLLHGLLILFTFRHYGMSWDQPSSHEYGTKVVRYYTTWGVDKTAITHWLHPYGGLFEITAALTETITGMNWFDARTLTSGLFGVLGTAAIIRCGWVIYGPAVGVTAGILLLLTPTYYGHQFINAKDLPFATLSMLALRYIAQLADQFPTLRWSTVIKSGLTIGAALGVRVGGLQLFGVLGCGILAAAWLKREKIILPSPANWGKWVAQGFTILALAWVVMLSAWPFALASPLTGPFSALKEFSKFWWDGNVFYGGQMLKTTELPWTYIPNLLVRTLPETVLLGLIAGLATIALAFARNSNDRRELFHPPTIAICCAWLLPLLAIWIMHARVYDGLRHVLFIFPPLVLLAAAGIYNCTNRLSSLRTPLIVCAVCGFGIATVCDLRALHPYQYIYFNRLVGGGLPTANHEYDLDYWATGLREAAEWVGQNYNPTPGQTVIYSSSAEPEQVIQFLIPKAGSKAEFRRAAPGEKARLFILIRRGRQHTELTWGKTLHTVSRQGVPLVDIVESP